MFTNLKADINRWRVSRTAMSQEAPASAGPEVQVPGQVPTGQAPESQIPVVQVGGNPMMEVNRSYQTQQVSFDPQIAAVQKYANLVELETAVKRIFSCNVSF